MAKLFSHKLKRDILLKEERKAIIKISQNKLHFRYNMIQSFQREPILCDCGEIMQYEETYDPLEGGKKNDRNYRERCIIESKYLSRRKHVP